MISKKPDFRLLFIKIVFIISYITYVRLIHFDSRGTNNKFGEVMDEKVKSYLEKLPSPQKEICKRIRKIMKKKL